jgi:hypothetical protein
MRNAHRKNTGNEEKKIWKVRKTEEGKETTDTQRKRKKKNLIVKVG